MPEGYILAALCRLLLMSESTGDRLFRQIADTWLGPVKDDPLDDYAEYAGREEKKTTLDDTYPDWRKIMKFHFDLPCSSHI